MAKRILLSSPHMSGGEQKYIQEAFDTNWIAPLGPNVTGFEEDLQYFLGPQSNVAALSTGTAALHLALILLGVTAGDEVLCQSLTFSASANPIVYLGATPVFIGSEKGTWNMCPDQLEIAIKDRLKKGKRVKAIIPVHLYGMPARMDKINPIASKYGIPVLEDAAEALGSHINGKYCGTFGEMACLSFNGNKIITTSGGGALVAHNRSLKDRAVFLATQARDEAPHYEHSEIGFNYRMSNICAGIGRGQMEVLEDRILSRRANFDYYKEAFRNIDGVSFAEEPAGHYSNRWLSCIIFDKRKNISRASAKEVLDLYNVDARPLWKPLHMQPVFKDAPYYGDDTAAYLFENGLCLPSGSNLAQEDLERVTTAVKNFF